MKKIVLILFSLLFIAGCKAPLDYYEQNYFETDYFPLKNSQAIELYNKGYDAFDAGNFELAKQYYLESLEIEENTLTHAELSVLYFEMQDYERSIQQCEIINLPTEDEILNLNCYYNIAYGYSMLNNEDKAYEYLAKLNGSDYLSDEEYLYIQEEIYNNLYN